MIHSPLCLSRPHISRFHGNYGGSRGGPGPQRRAQFLFAGRRSLLAFAGPQKTPSLCMSKGYSRFGRVFIPTARIRPNSTGGLLRRAALSSTAAHAGTQEGFGSELATCFLMAALTVCYATWGNPFVALTQLHNSVTAARAATWCHSGLARRESPQHTRIPMCFRQAGLSTLLAVS